VGLSRMEFWSRIGLNREIDPLVVAAYRFGALMKQLQSDKGEDHADLWHLSFHGSQFPGANPHACPRQGLYRMMDFARPVMPRWLEQVAESGKAIENSLVAKWYRAGYLVSPPSFLPGVDQLQFEDGEHWLTCTTDALVCWPRDTEAIVCEVKSKEADVIRSMQRLIRGPDIKQAWQVKTEICMAHEAGPIKKLRCYNTGRFAVMDTFKIIDDKLVVESEICPQHGHDRCLREVTIDPPTRGYLYYVSRDNPEDTFEFMFEYDPEWIKAGRGKLKRWRQWFIDDILPASNFDEKRFSHPLNWQWTKDEYPCKWCDYGQVCRDDHRAAVELGRNIRLSESAGIEDTREIREAYDPALARESVLAFWSDPNRSQLALGRELEPIAVDSE
jgi:hypothetical protein